MPEPWRNPATARRCDGKQAFRKPEAAERRAQKDSAKTGDLIIAYRCLDCVYWHVGHADASQILARLTQGRVCADCDGGIAKSRREQCARSGMEAQYCSLGCSNRARKKRKRARRWTECSEVEQVPGRMGGVPVLKGTRVQADSVVDNYQSGTPVTEIADMFDLDPHQVQAVIDYSTAMDISTPSR